MTPTSPRVSVLLPVRNAARTLDEALASIRSQTLAELEVVAVDDGSEDGSRRILQGHARQDSRIRILEQPPSGIVKALEAARRNAHAPILARMDADDRAAGTRLEAQLAFLAARPDVALCGTHVRYFPRSKVRAGALRYEGWLNAMHDSGDLVRDLWVECPLAHPSFAIRASTLDRLGGYRDEGWPEDYDLVLRLWMAGEGLGVVPRVLHHWREGAQRLSRVDPRYDAASFRRAKLHFLARTLLKSRDGLVIWGAGPDGKAFARAALSQEIPVHAFVDLDPRKIGQTIHGAPVLSPAEGHRFPQALGVAAVSGLDARRHIRAVMRDLGREEGVDFVTVA